MSAAHTPGPWRVNTDDLSSSVYGYVFSETGAICRVFLDGDECEANIRLISAAPDLLEALKDAYPYIDNDNLRTRIGNLISKATGSAS